MRHDSVMPTLDVAFLDTFDARLRAFGAPVCDAWAPGCSDTHLDALLWPLGIELPEEARVWWRWHNGTREDAPMVDRNLGTRGPLTVLLGGKAASGNHPDPLAGEPQCPRGALTLPADGLVGATRAALREAPLVYPHKDLRGMSATSATFESIHRSGYAKVTCGKRAHSRTVVVGLRFRPPRQSASLSFGVVMVSRFRDGYHVWAVKH